MSKPAILAGAALAWLFCANVAAAQTDGSSFARNKSVSVKERPKPGYEAVGHRFGSFMVYPRVEAGVNFDDNIYATSTAETSDTVWVITPSVDVTSNWSRHQLSANASVNFNEYSDNSNESTTTYNIGANGRVDVSRDTQITGKARYVKSTEPRSAIDAAQNLNEPVKYDVQSYSAGGSKEFNRLRINGGVDIQKYAYKDGRFGALNVPQGYRDRTARTINGRVDYSVSPDTYLYVTAEQNDRSYDITTPVFGDRDSDGYSVAVGGDFDLTNLARGHLQVGYMQQKFDDQVRFGKVDGISVAGDIDYFLTQLTTVNFRASRNFQDSGLTNSAGYSSTSGGISVDHELLRNVILNARFDYEQAEHEGIDREDRRINFSAGGTYLLNRALGLTASYSYFNQESSGLNRGFDFTINRVQLLLTLQY